MKAWPRFSVRVELIGAVCDTSTRNHPRRLILESSGRIYVETPILHTDGNERGVLVRRISLPVPPFQPRHRNDPERWKRDRKLANVYSSC